MPAARRVGIVGAGTMGAGIAQLAATHGWETIVVDVDVETVRKAIGGVRARLDSLVAKGRMESAQRDAASKRLGVAGSTHDLADAPLVIEAVVERMDAKVEALRPVASGMAPDAIIATNTSSLSVGELGERLGVPGRVAGMHFFNPAPLMPLVEIVRGARTEAGVAQRLAEVAREWGRTPVLAADTPGFIVNRVARPYYLEGFRMLEEGWGSAEEIDEAMRAIARFRMGPLELTDLIGQDVNAATTEGVFMGLGRPARLRPSTFQQELVREGRLGRKSGRGVYAYGPGGERLEGEPRRALAPASAERERALEGFARALWGEVGSAAQRRIAARGVATIVGEAIIAERAGIASREDIDSAMRLGVGYPAGPFEWLAASGEGRVAAALEYDGERASWLGTAPGDS